MGSIVEEIENRLFCCDNLDLLDKIPDETLDLIYCDVLYGTGKSFTHFRDIKADEKVVKDFYECRLALMKNKLKKTGSIYIQINTRINHWLRIIMDEIFGYDNFRNEIIWWKESFSEPKGGTYLKRHDNILFYSKSDEFYFEPQYIYNSKKEKRIKKGFFDTGDSYLVYDKKKFNKFKNKQESLNKFKNKPIKYRLNEKPSTKCHDVINDIGSVKHNSKEYVGYSTQKPMELMKRIILSSSKENDLVGDFFLGSGSFVVQAFKLRRRYIGCDINPEAIKICENRLNSIINSKE